MRGTCSASSMRRCRSSDNRWDDLDLENGIAVIRRSALTGQGKQHEIDTKSHRIRVVPLPPFLCQELNHHGALENFDSFSWEGGVFTSPQAVRCAGTLQACVQTSTGTGGIDVFHYLSRPPPYGCVSGRQQELRERERQDRPAAIGALLATGDYGDLYALVPRGDRSSKGSLERVFDCPLHMRYTTTRPRSCRHAKRVPDLRFCSAPGGIRTPEPRIRSPFRRTLGDLRVSCVSRVGGPFRGNKGGRRWTALDASCCMFAARLRHAGVARRAPAGAAFNVRNAGAW